MGKVGIAILEVYKENYVRIIYEYCHGVSQSVQNGLTNYSQLKQVKHFPSWLFFKVFKFLS